MPHAALYIIYIYMSHAICIEVGTVLNSAYAACTRAHVVSVFVNSGYIVHLYAHERLLISRFYKF